MTKRYSYFKSEITGLFVISDEKHRETFSGMENEYNCSRIVYRLNTLAEENEQLKSDVKEYIKGLEKVKATSQSWASDVRELREQNCRLEKENEQLKSDLDYFKAKNGSLETGMFNLERENEQLKSENNMLKVTIGRNEAYIKRLTETSEWHC